MDLRTIRRQLVPEFPKGTEEAGFGTGPLRYDRIWLSAVLATVVVSIIPLGILSVWNWLQYQKALEGEIIFPAHNLVSNAQGSLLLFLDERKSVLKYIALDNSFDALSDQTRLNGVFANLKTALGDITDLGVVTADGLQVAYLGPYDLKGVNYRNEPWFKEATLRGEYISDVFLGFRDYPHIVIAIKRQYDNGDFCVLRATVDTQEFDRLVQSLSPRPSTDTFLINGDGVVQTPTRFNGDVLQPLKLELPPALNQSQVVEIRSGDGEELVAGYARIEGTPFTFVVVRPKQEMMSGIESFLGRLVAFLVLSVIVILFVTLRISTLMVNNLQDADRQRVRALHEIEYSAKMASLGRLAAGVAHEINNPLAIINEKAGFIKDLLVITREGPTADQLLRPVDSILQSVGRCAAVTKRLLGFARHIDVQNEPIDLEALIDEVCGFLAQEAEHRCIQIIISREPDVPTVLSDHNQLQQAFLNIINNAFAAVGNGGRIRIHVAREGSEMVAVAVTDNGTGIRREDLSRIFEPFFTTKGREGTGLGLSITYGIVKKLGGDIRVESQVDEGSTFTVVLPLTAPDADTPRDCDENPTGR